MTSSSGNGHMAPGMTGTW